MKPVAQALLLASFLFSCNDSNSDTQAVENDTTQSNTGKPSLSAALDKLRLTLQAGQKEDIVDLISFPLTESQMDLYVDDSLFQQDFVAAGNKLTRDLFLKHYDKIAKFTYLDEIGNVFSHLSIDSLAHNSEIKKEYKDKEEPCTKYYSLAVDNNLVTLKFGTNPNQEFISKEGDTDAIAGCEYAVFWTFRYEDGKLRFVKQAAAG